MAKGRFIVLEGPDGCGKSTQARLLAERLKSSGRRVELVRDPGGTPVGEAIRGILLNPHYPEMSVRTELLLYMASRAQLLEEIIQPALDQGGIVLSDRYLISTVVYQGFAGGLSLEEIHGLYRYACGDTYPDLVVILDVPVEVGRSRLSGDLDRMEAKSVPFHEKVRQGYLKAAEQEPGTHVVIDGSDTVEAVADAVWRVVDNAI